MTSNYRGFKKVTLNRLVYDISFKLLPNGFPKVIQCPSVEKQITYETRLLSPVCYTLKQILVLVCSSCSICS